MDRAGNLYGTAVGEDGTVFELTHEGKKWKQNVLHRFCSEFNCADGGDPLGTLVVDVAGNLYGTTFIGGSSGQGVVFELIPNADRSKWKLRVLHNIGGHPQAGLAYAGQSTGSLYDGKSPLYGTTYEGGADGQGAVFEIRPRGRGWQEQTLYSFCTYGGCTDGAYPTAGVTVDSAGNLYGTTYGGGDGDGGGGVVFELSGGHGVWSEKVLYSFCSQKNCADGKGPYGGVIRDKAGNLYGTTMTGGLGYNKKAQKLGVVFKLAPDGSETVLYSFCSEMNCSDGAVPVGGLVMDSSGNLFGTTVNGGIAGDGGDGVLFELNNTYSVLHTFCSSPDCADGANPQASLLLTGAGRLYGTTVQGGRGGNTGTVFTAVP